MLRVHPTAARQESSAAGTPERLAQVARDFEALLLYQLYRQLQQPLFEEEQEEGLFSGTNSLLGEYALLPFAEFLAHSGGGIGFARWLYRHWTGQELPLRSVRVQPVGASSAVPADTASGRAAPVSDAAAPEPLPEPLRRYWKHIRQAAAEAGIPAELIAAVVWVESAGNPAAVSPKGAKGLMQLMDSTARMLGVRNVFDPEENLQAGARYLRQLLEEFGSLPLALAAYNAGPARVRSAGGIPPFAETRSYVERVVQLYRQWAL